MKRFRALLFATLMSISLLAGCAGNEPAPSPAAPSAPSKDGEKFTIGIVQPMEHPSLNTIRESIIEGLNELGLSDKVEIVYKNAPGAPPTINTIVSQFVEF